MFYECELCDGDEMIDRWRRTMEMISTKKNNRHFFMKFENK